MAVRDQLATATPPVGRAGPPADASLRDRVRRSPFLIAAVLCIALAALSAALLATVPSYDPWSWIVWGREVTDPHLGFTVSGGPSWKPLPFLFTMVFGVFGGAAPTLWVITARAGGLLGLVAAYRLGSLLASRAGAGRPRAAGASAGRPRAPVAGASAGRRWVPVVAGTIAALAVALTQEWSYYMFRGTSEPMLIGSALWAVDRHVAGRHRQAFAFGVAASLIRPEAWPFVLAYAIWLWRREPAPATRVPIAAGLLVIPLLWFVPPWIGSGEPFLAASHAKAYNGHLGSHPLLEVLRRGADLQLVPMLVFGLVATALAWVRERDRLVLGLAAGALGWWVLVVAMTLDGYPGLERFFLPAAGLTCALGGVGVVRVAGLLAGSLAPRRTGAANWLAGALTLVLVAGSLAVSTSRIDEVRAQPGRAGQAVTRFDQLSAAVRAVGGHQGVFPCRTSFAAVNHSAQTALAWKLHVTLGRVGTSMRHPGVLFVGPHDSIDGAPAAISSGLDRRRLLARVGAWRVYQVWRQDHLSACLGS